MLVVNASKQKNEECKLVSSTHVTHCFILAAKRSEHGLFYISE